MRDDERIAGQGEGQDALDRRIGAALRSYTEPPALAEPRIALAQIMERARGERPARQPRWWIWGLAAAAVCLIAAVLAVRLMPAPRLPEIAKSPHAPGVVTVPASPDHSAIAEARVPAIRRTPHPASTAGREVAAALPKLDVFPTPEPLSPQEQALLAFATNVPPKAQQQVVNAERHIGDPITIAALKIRPLDVSEQPNSNKER